MKTSLNDSVSRIIRSKTDAKPNQAQIWSIGIYAGESPFNFDPAQSANNPVLTGDSVSDVRASFVADPFMLKAAGTWHIFFEIMNSKSGRGEIGLAVSQDAAQWQYRQVVLREPFHLSYPYVFEWDNEVYMIPESYQAKSVRLYKAFDFPTRWSFIGDLLTGDHFQDSSIFRCRDRWWLLTDVAQAPHYAGILRLFHAESITGPWIEHPKSPVIEGNSHIARPAGRVLAFDDRVIRYTQDCDPVYGSQVRAFEITELTTSSYQEREVCKDPILTASGAGWNGSGMHHIDPHRIGDSRWIACVDGFFWQASRADPNGEPNLQNSPVTGLKRRLRSYKPYIVASEIKAVLRKHLKRAGNPIEVMSLKPVKTSRGDVLFSYVTHAFSGQAVPYSHTSYWESRRMAETFVDLGYSVDVISAADARGFLPQKHYDFFIGHRHNFERIAQRLNTDCVKVLHCDVAHWLFHNTAGSRRLLALQQRKGITLLLLRLQAPNLAIESADCATVLGNEFTIGTYKYADKPIYRVPISAPALYPWPEGKDFEACRRHFIWFGSNGFVHKGLDLVLEAFAAMPEYHLTVCGPITDEVEREFEKAFFRELYQTANIRTVGWIDDAGPEFLRIAKSCVGVINPSCSEGGGGSVITCMHAGLIPIVSHESSVDIGDFGYLLPDCSVESIRNSIKMVADFPVRSLVERARQAWEFARAHHTKEKFAEEYKRVAETIVSTHGREGNSLATLCHKGLNTTTGSHGHKGELGVTSH